MADSALPRDRDRYSACCTRLTVLGGAHPPLAHRVFADLDGSPIVANGKVKWGSFMFHYISGIESDAVTVVFEGEPVVVPKGTTAAAVALMRGDGAARTSPVLNSPRAPYCMMGACFECRMEIDGRPDVQGCLITVHDGMTIRRQCPGKDAGHE